MSKLMKKLQRIVSEAVERAKKVALEMVDEIDERYGDRLRSLASRLGTPLYLCVEEGVNAPLLVTLKLYHGGDKSASEAIIRELGEAWQLYPLSVEPAGLRPDDYARVYEPKEEVG